MYKTTSMSWPRHILPVAMLGFLLAIAMFAASSIFTSDRASAQQAASTFEVLRATPPNLSASIGIGEINLTWTYNTPAPTGWKHIGFTLVRANADTDTVDKTFPEQSTSTRSFTDTLDNLSEADWLAGFQYKYFIGAVYQRLSDGAYQRDAASIIQVWVPAAVTSEEVAQYRRPPVLSSRAHADGVNLTWTRPLDPPGWKLADSASGAGLKGPKAAGRGSANDSRRRLGASKTRSPGPLKRSACLEPSSSTRCTPSSTAWQTANDKRARTRKPTYSRRRPCRSHGTSR